MTLLAVDTSSTAASAAVINEKGVIGEYSVINNKTHSQNIMPLIDSLLNLLDIDVREIDVFAAAYGPGSFTGLRIGVATVKGLAQATGKQVVGVSILDGLAQMFPFTDMIISPILDARRNQVYNAFYRFEDCSNDCFNESRLKIIKDYRAIGIEELISELNGKKAIFTGDGVDAYKDILNKYDNLYIAPENLRYSSIGGIAQAAYSLALQGKTVHYAELEPIYLRLSQAERMLLEKEGVKS